MFQGFKMQSYFIEFSNSMGKIDLFFFPMLSVREEEVTYHWYVGLHISKFAGYFPQISKICEKSFKLIKLVKSGKKGGMFASDLKKTQLLQKDSFPVPFLTSDAYGIFQGSLGRDSVVSELFWASVNEQFLFLHSLSVLFQYFVYHITNSSLLSCFCLQRLGEAGNE